MRRLLQIALVAAFPPWVFAQGVSVHSPSRSPSPAQPSPSAPVQGVRSLPPSENVGGFRGSHSHHANPIPLFPFGLFSDSLFPGNPTPQPSAPAAPSALNLMEALSALGKVQEQPQPPAAPSQPLLIELQGDRYVRLNSGDASESPQDSREPIRVIASESAGKQRSTQSAVPRNSAARELPAAVLIYRDGHREEVRDYSIVAGVIYARGDYYTDGYWNKKIELTSLNLPETLKSNELRGVPFILPNAPNEVVTRP
jgi:hypothetical protein